MNNYSKNIKANILSTITQSSVYSSSISVGKSLDSDE